MLGEDVEDQHRAIDDLHLGRVADRARLAGREVGIEDDDVGAELHRAQQDLVELAAPDEEPRIGLGPALDQDVEHLDAGGAAQLAQLGDARLLVAGAAELDVDEQRALLAARAGAGLRGGDAVGAAVLGLEARDQLEEVGARRGGGLGRQLAPRPIGRRVGQQVADEQLAGPAGGVDGDRGDRVEPQQREVGEIVARQRLPAQVGVHEAQAAEPAGAAAHAADVREEEPGRVADHHGAERRRADRGAGRPVGAARSFVVRAAQPARRR